MLFHRYGSKSQGFIFREKKSLARMNRKHCTDCFSLEYQRAKHYKHTLECFIVHSTMSPKGLSHQYGLHHIWYYPPPPLPPPPPPTPPVVFTPSRQVCFPFHVIDAPVILRSLIKSRTHTESTHDLSFRNQLNPLESVSSCVMFYKCHNYNHFYSRKHCHFLCPSSGPLGFHSSFCEWCCGKYNCASISRFILESLKSMLGSVVGGSHSRSSFNLESLSKLMNFIFEIQLEKTAQKYVQLEKFYYESFGETKGT